MVHEVDAEIFEATDRLDRLADAADQQQAWLGVSRLAARVEQERLLADHRFGATAAYARIVTDRMNDLREEKFVGTSTWTKFIERRFMPAVRTCEAADSRLENLARRVARTGDLLQARIQLSLEAQNARLFEAMNSASQRQVRLQQTVEGLSVAAISYYVVGLIKLAIDGVPGLPRPDLFVAASVLPVVLAVWWTVRSIRRRIGTHAAD
jgi:uncharacterized membrane-anchored protein